MNRFTFYARCSSCGYRSDDYETPAGAEAAGTRHEYEKRFTARGTSHDTNVVTEDN